MNLRVLRTELKRSVALWAGAAVLATALAFLYLLGAGTGWGVTAWTAQWTSLALWTRGLLSYLWPLAVGLGALQGLRDHRSKVSELLMSTPRPAWHRAAVSAGTTAAALVAAFALLVLQGGAQVLAKTEYTHLGWLPISLVGALALAAGAVLGMGAGRALPSVLTPPALAMTAFVFTTLTHMASTRRDPRTGFERVEPNTFSLLSPAAQEVRDVFVTLSASVHLGQTLWLLGMAATGLALLVAARPRTRLLALTPLVAGALLALVVLPTDPNRMYVADKAAAELVCDGPVCVARAHQGRLADIADPGEKALRLLRGALGGRAPVSVHEDTAAPDGTTPRWPRETVLFGFDDELITGAGGEELTRALIATSMVPGCSPFGRGATAGYDDITAQTAAVGWVLGDLKPLGGSLYAEVDAVAKARPVWEELRALPRAEQLSRVNAMRDAAHACQDTVLDALKGGASR
ncbi:hypothetical protein [Streptomyces paludis]|uniref:Uncharacterized protein n=1 Tax=Streptomyces paludis TaxID=2282738 RepID=A0A345HYK6_9ACTN|nr:hypothetical protein [Streptomyces paludis]AXG81780.1 hypothetical protein DVK44_33205 [Streptomyces paludis]